MKVKKYRSLFGRESRRDSVIIGNSIKLRGKRLSDARNDYRWQSDPELARLDAAPLLEVAYALYLLEYTDQLYDTKSKRFPLAIETADGKHIGNCTCYDIDEAKGEAQIGIMIGDRDYWDKGYGADAVIAMVGHVFLNSDIRRIYLKTLDWNRRARQCFARCGFVPCGQIARNGSKFVVMELLREHWAARPGMEEVEPNR